MLSRFLTNDDGADLIEYALLASIIGIGSVLVFPELLSALFTAFTGWGTGVNDIWIPNPPL